MTIIFKQIKLMDPVTGRITSKSNTDPIVLTRSHIGVMVSTGLTVYHDGNDWIYEPPGHAILSRNYPGMEPKEEE